MVCVVVSVNEMVVLEVMKSYSVATNMINKQVVVVVVVVVVVYLHGVWLYSSETYFDSPPILVVHTLNYHLY